MVKNFKGGKKSRKTSRNYNRVIEFPKKKDDEPEEYGIATTKPNGRHCTVLLPSGEQVLGVIPGSFKRKKKFIDNKSILLVQLRLDMNRTKPKVDILHVYDKQQVDSLIESNELPDKIKKKMNETIEDRYENDLSKELEVSDEETEEPEDFYESLRKATVQINIDDI